MVLPPLVLPSAITRTAVASAVVIVINSPSNQTWGRYVAVRFRSLDGITMSWLRGLPSDQLSNSYVVPPETKLGPAAMLALKSTAALRVKGALCVVPP